MNPDLMITIVFSLWVLLGWGAWGVLFVRTVRNEKAEEADRQRLDAVPERAVANMQPRAARAADKLRRSSAAARSSTARSCSQTRTTDHPSATSVCVLRASRLWFRASFADQ